MPFTPSTGDPTYKSAHARRIRAQAKRRDQAADAPCTRCGRRIHYTAPYWLTDAYTGRRTVNPVAYVAGHIVAHADHGPYELANLQPECGRCSTHSGAVDGNRRQRAAQATRAPGPTLVVDDW